MTASPLKIVMSGMVAGDPHQGGATWAVLQYVLGLRELGHQVLLVEPVRKSSIRPAGATLHQSVNAAYFRDVMRDFSLENHASLLLEGDRKTVGLPYDAVAEFARHADLLFNVSGMLSDPYLTERIGTRAYLDLDPGFVQLWHAVEGIDMRFDGHTHFITVGLAMGSTTCRAPDCGRPWITTLQPVALQHWAPGGDVVHHALTTVGNWRGYGSVHHDGVHYGQKAHSFREFMELPRLTGTKFLLAMDVHPGETADLAALHEADWQLVSPRQVASTPRQYQQFVQQSYAEIGVAKSGYVKSQCGWFSDRSACYLASGRPVVAQDTGFSRHVPTGGGLLSFRTTIEAVRAIDCLQEDYEAHRLAARSLAERYFASDRVLTRLLKHVGLAA